MNKISDNDMTWLESEFDAQHMEVFEPQVKELLKEAFDELRQRRASEKVFREQIHSLIWNWSASPYDLDEKLGDQVFDNFVGDLSQAILKMLDEGK